MQDVERACPDIPKTGFGKIIGNEDRRERIATHFGGALYGPTGAHQGKRRISVIDKISALFENSCRPTGIRQGHG